MSQIDWSKAPEGATHYCDLVGGFVKFEGERVSLLDRLNTGKVWCRPVSIAFDLVSSLMPRPWTGEGLPPVGLGIEWESDYGWLGGKVVGHDQTITIVRHNCGYTGCHPHQVRPIRTPEQIAAETIEKAINAMAEILTHDGSFFQDAERLYDAGYRKFEIADE